MGEDSVGSRNWATQCATIIRTSFGIVSIRTFFFFITSWWTVNQNQIPFWYTTSACIPFYFLGPILIECLLIDYGLLVSFFHLHLFKLLLLYLYLYSLCTFRKYYHHACVILSDGSGKTIIYCKGTKWCYSASSWQLLDIMFVTPFSSCRSTHQELTVDYAGCHEEMTCMSRFNLDKYCHFLWPRL